jgi:nucleoside-diphosphate-sugar epimerase
VEEGGCEMGSLEETNVLVTGAIGFIGSHLVKRLVEEGARINIISRSDGIRKNVILRNLDAELKICKANLLDYTSIKKCADEVNPEKVFHLGAFVDLKRDFQTANECVQTNIQGTLNMLNALKDINCSSLIHLGTYEVYGFNTVPFREDQPVDPLSPYSISKACSEFFCRFANKIYDIPTVLLRLSNVYGPNQKSERLIPYVINCAIKKEAIKLTEGNQTRDYLYVDDAIEAIIKSSLTKEVVSEVINIGSGKEYKIKEVVQKILDLMDCPIIPQYGELEHRAYEPERWYCDITKAKKLLEWAPHCSLDDGLKKTIGWYLGYNIQR